MEYPENAILGLTQNTYQHFYDGSEIVVAGRLVGEDVNSFKADVKGHGVSGDRAWKRDGDGVSAVVGLWPREGPGVVAPEPDPPRPPAPCLLPPPPQAANDLTFTEEVDMKEMEKALQERDYIFGNYIERLWAYLTIEQLLEKR